MSLLWRTVGNTVFDLTGPRFKSQTSRSRVEYVTLDQLAGYTLIFKVNVQKPEVICTESTIIIATVFNIVLRKLTAYSISNLVHQLLALKEGKDEHWTMICSNGRILRTREKPKKAQDRDKSWQLTANFLFGEAHDDW